MLGGIIREIEEMEYPKDEIIRGFVGEDHKQHIMERFLKVE